METTMNTIKRPVIFVKNLSHEEAVTLFDVLINSDLIDLSEIIDTTQIFTLHDAKLDIVHSTNVFEDEEILCTTYDDFITRWEQYRLSQLL